MGYIALSIMWDFYMSNKYFCRVLAYRSRITWVTVCNVILYMSAVTHLFVIQWRYDYVLALAYVIMAWCLMAPRYYLSQCWLWYPETHSCNVVNSEQALKISIGKLGWKIALLHITEVNWLKSLQFACVRRIATLYDAGSCRTRHTQGVFKMCSLILTYLNECVST